jgi:ribonuclease HI
VVQEVYYFYPSITASPSKLGFGQGINNKVELCALWLLLKLAANKGISSLQVIGDSKLVEAEKPMSPPD